MKSTSRLAAGRRILAACAAAVLLAASSATDETLLLQARPGPGAGKHVVIVTGDEEYRSEESGPMLAKILSQRHGFDCTVVFSWTEDFIDPNNQAGLRGLEALDSADLMIVATRFRRPDARQAAHVTRFLNAGKPVIGLRTATHAFAGPGAFGDGDHAIPFTDFGIRVLGERWVRHHGRHGRQGCRGVIESRNAAHPILRGVEDVFAPSDVYGVEHLTGSDTILMRGAVTGSLEPDSPILPGEINDPMQPLAWLHRYTAPNGKTSGTSFCTTAGASVDLVCEDLRRLVVNACYHLTGLEVPASASVEPVDPYYPSFYGFVEDDGWFEEADLRAADFGLGESPFLEDPPGAPHWPFRPMPPGGERRGARSEREDDAEAAGHDEPWMRMDHGSFLSTAAASAKSMRPCPRRSSSARARTGSLGSVRLRLDPLGLGKGRVPAEPERPLLGHARKLHARARPQSHLEELPGQHQLVGREVVPVRHSLPVVPAEARVQEQQAPICTAGRAPRRSRRSSPCRPTEILGPREDHHASQRDPDTPRARR